MAYTYKMVQVPPDVVVEAKSAQASPAAGYLEDVVNQWAQQGWEFYSVETIGVVERPGCLAALLGAKSTATDYYVIVFRRST
jgi:hypothetical protein